MSNVTITAANMYTPSANLTASSAYYSTSTNASLFSTGATTWNAPSLSSSFTCATDAEFKGDIKWKGRSLGKLLESIEDRLAILAEPDPERLEKFGALKKAYEHYKLMEKLIGEE
jgi:hypothetical protein